MVAQVETLNSYGRDNKKLFPSADSPEVKPEPRDISPPLTWELSHLDQVKTEQLHLKPHLIRLQTLSPGPCQHELSCYPVVIALFAKIVDINHITYHLV